MNAELTQFVRDALARGVPRDTIRAKLAEARWRPEEIDAALASWADTEFPIPVPRRRAYLSAREAFLYLVLFVTLYTSAFNVGAMLFQFIERWLPDPATARGWSGSRFSPNGVRDSAAALLIAVPVFIWLSRYVGRLMAQEPDKRGSKVRKWLTYLTLFVAAIVFLGDLVFLVSRLLGGELPPRFVAKVVVVGTIAGYVFGHYLADLRRDEDEHGAVRAAGASPLARVAGGLVVLVLGIGLFVAGSPARSRSEDIDQTRVRDLQQLSYAIQSYYGEERALPANLDAAVSRPGGGTGDIQDPVTRVPYEFRQIDSTHYELCASFDLADSIMGKGYAEPMPESRFWRHPAGRHCYALAIPRALVAGKGP